ncbi:MAG: hypothetical protein AAFV26_05560 [Pseudomonadota bacterium]
MTAPADQNTEFSEREEIEMLLPWYVMGTLDDADRARVASYLEAHPEMRAQLALIEDERVADVTVNEAIAPPATLTADRLLARAKPSPTKAASAGLSTLWGELSRLFSAPTAGAVRFAAAAAIAIIAAQAVAIGVVSTASGPGAPGYEVASGNTGTAVPAGTDALIRFKDTATASEVLADLGALNLRVVDGPDANGFLVVRIGPKEMDDAAVNARLGEIRTRAASVMFVGKKAAR